MKKITMTFALLAALSATASATASEFDGGFVGARIGATRSSITGPLGVGINGSDASTIGLDGGYNWMAHSYLLGVDAFADSNSNVDNVSSHGYGADLKVGLPHNNWLPYMRLGYGHMSASLSANSLNGSGFHGGLGLEFKFAPSWGANAEWLTSYGSDNGSKMNNDGFGLGLRYYFAAPKAAPAPVAVQKEPAPEPVAMAEPTPAQSTPVAEPAPAEAPAPQPKAPPAPHKLIKIEGVNFATDSAALLKGADAKLHEVLMAAKEYPDDKLEASGHTDSTGKKAHNQQLSERRAATVKAWLVKHGIAAERINTVGYGDTKPVASNKTKAGRAANRRVEVRYTAKE